MAYVGVQETDLARAEGSSAGQQALRSLSRWVLAEEHHQREKQRDRNSELKSDAGLLWEGLGRPGDPCFLGIKVKQEQEVV